MNHSERFRINAPKVVHETIDGEVVIVHLEKGSYYSLIKEGADIWSQIISGFSRGEIQEYTIQRYDGDRENIEKGVNNFIAELQGEEVIILNETGEPENATVKNQPTETEKPIFQAPSLQKYTDMEELLALDPIHEVDEEIGWPNAKVAV